MPYIKKEDQDKYTNTIFSEIRIDHVSHLNYLISKLCAVYLSLFGDTYHTRNDIVGALECAKLEFVRRKVEYYEDIKKAMNGDIY